MDNLRALEAKQNADRAVNESKEFTSDVNVMLGVLGTMIDDLTGLFQAEDGGR